MACWRRTIVVGLERTCAALDTASSELGRLLHTQALGGAGCRLGLSTLAHALNERWGVLPVDQDSES